MVEAARPTRRSVLRAGVGALAGATALSTLMGCGSNPPPDATLREGVLTSRFGLDAPRWRLAVPRSGPPRGLVVVLHGHTGTADAAFDLGYADAVGTSRLALVSVDGGDGYWHARNDGTDSGAMVRDELIPLALRESGLSASDRIGLLGWSMGGFGALLIASDLGPERVSGVVAASAALWRNGGDTPARAYDGRADFDRHSIFNRIEKLEGIPVRLDCGLSDPFIAANQALAKQLPGVETHFEPGGHEDAWWGAHAAAEMAWLAARA